jgi:hypothetical protein
LRRLITNLTKKHQSTSNTLNDYKYSKKDDKIIIEFNFHFKSIKRILTTKTEKKSNIRKSPLRQKDKNKKTISVENNKLNKIDKK